MKTFNLKILTPDGVAFEGEVGAVFARGSEGDLAIMANHVPILTFVQKGKCKLLLPDDTEKIASIDGGTLNVKKELTTVMCGCIKWDK